MNFKRLLYFFGVKEALKERLIASGMEPENAGKAAHVMNAGNLEQVAKDLARTPSIEIVNKSTGFKTSLTAEQTLKFQNAEEAKAFLKQLSGDQEALFDYLSKYLHQGGFINAAELLMTYYFANQPGERGLLLPTGNRKATFTIEEDGSLSFEESFDIESIKSPNGLDYKAPEGPIASFSLKSTMRQENGKISHEYQDIEVKAHDQAAKKLFHDPRGPWPKFIEWIKNTFKLLFSSTAKAENAERQAIPKPLKKL